MRSSVVLLLLAAAPVLGAQPTPPSALPPRTVAVLPSERPAPDTATAANPSPNPAPTPAPAEAKAPAAALQVGVGTVRFGGLLQAWYVDGPGDQVTSTFRVRRAELRFAGEVTPTARWTLMLDLAKTLKVTDGRANPTTHLLQDAYVTLDAGPLEIDAGQLKLPLGHEGSVASSARLETIERTPFITEGKLGMVRDLGVLVGVPLGRGARLGVGAFNGVGEGQNGQDADDAKIGVARLELPTIGGLRVAASGAYGGARDDARRDRLGADAVLAAGPATVRVEWMRALDGAVQREGWYGLAAYRVGDWQLVGRHDVFDRDRHAETGAADMRERDWTAGVTYLVSGSNVRVQANYVRRTFATQPGEGMLYAAVQTAW